jgi:hypothetical protein
MEPKTQNQSQRRAPGWFLLAISIGGIGLVLFQMSKDNLPSLRPDPSPPVVEPTPTLWSPKTAVTQQAPTAEKAPLATSAPEPTEARKPLPSEAVKAAIEQWEKAWRSRDADTYLAFYAEDFQGREAFVRQKQRVMRRAQFIEVKVTQLRLTPLANGQTEARFVQFYRSDSFENQTLKRQVWKSLPSGELRILEESS